MSSRRKIIEKLKTSSTDSLKSKYLKPKGLEVKKIKMRIFFKEKQQKFGANKPKERRVKNFLDWKMTLKRGGKELEWDNYLIFEVEEKASKPEIKQYLEKGI